MTEQDYELQQLKLIAATYEAKGYQVAFDVLAPGTDWHFDAVAQGPDKRIVIIELVNATRPAAVADVRLDLLRRAADIYPNADVDLRYIDARQARLRNLQERLQDDEGLLQLRLLNAGLKVGLPRKPTESLLSLQRCFIALWAIHVSVLRPLFLLALTGPHHSLELLEQYDLLLKKDVLVAPEQSEDEVNTDLSELYTLAQGVVEGAAVTSEEVSQLRAHVRAVRKQVRRWKAKDGKAVISGLTAATRGKVR